MIPCGLSVRSWTLDGLFHVQRSRPQIFQGLDGSGLRLEDSARSAGRQQNVLVWDLLSFPISKCVMLFLGAVLASLHPSHDLEVKFDLWRASLTRFCPSCTIGVDDKSGTMSCTCGLFARSWSLDTFVSLSQNYSR